MKTITILTGTPHQRGSSNTHLLVEAFIEGVRERFHEIIRFDTAMMNISGCLDCKYCRQNDGNCQQQDDMQKIYQALRKSDVLVLASPLYWFDFTSQLKAALDRMYPCTVKPYPIKESVLLLDGEIHLGDGAIAVYKAMCTYLNWRDRGIIVETEIREKEKLLGKDALLKIKELGQNILQ